MNGSPQEPKRCSPAEQSASSVGSVVQTAAPPDSGTSGGARAGWDSTRARIAAACLSAGRGPDAVALLAVSKTFPAERVAALARLGQRDFGENYLQEATAKMDACCALLSAGQAASLRWHFIGPIQSNKTRPIAEHFDWVHSVDRVRIAQRLGEQRPAALAPLECCVQVNVSGEASKSGCDPQEALEVARAIAHQPRLRLRGVMAIPEPTKDVALQRQRFAQARAVLDEIRAALQPTATDVDTLSMGMSADLEAAIAEGATIVRVGTALFGSRPAKPAQER